MAGEAWTVLSVAAAVVAAAAFLVAHRRRPAGLGRAGAIELVSSRYLGGKRFLTLVEVEGERLLIALSGDTVSLVARLGRRAPRRAAAEAKRPQGAQPC